MKKIISILLLITVGLSLGFAASKKGKSNNIKLDPKNKFAIEGVELGSIDLGLATITNKGEIIWSQDADGQWRETGWELRGIDLSAYAGIRIELAKGQKFENIDLALSNPAVTDDWCFKFNSDGVAYIYFNGMTRAWGDMKDPDPKEGFALRINGEVASYKKTKIKSVELIRIEDMPEVSNLSLLGVQFGSFCKQTKISGNEITFLKGTQDGQAGWYLEGIDFSEYDRVRIELESNEVPGLDLSINQRDGKNYYQFTQQVEKNVFDIYLSGEGYSYKNEDSGIPDKSEGFSIYLHSWTEEPRTKDQKTVVKSVQLLKGRREYNDNLKLLGKDFGSYRIYASVYNGGIISWEGNKEGWGLAGWNVEDIDLSAYKTIRIELGPEAAQQSLDLKLELEDDISIYFSPVSPTILEANFDGSDYSRDDGKKLNPSIKIRNILIQCNGLKKDQQTIVKSITLLTKEEAEAKVKQPADIMLNGARLGSKRERAWIDENFAVNWNIIRDGYAQCGWRFDSLEGEILVIKVSSTDVPLRLRIRDYANENESSFLDNGSHIFVINLKTKKQQNGKNWNESEWNKNSKSFDFSQGGDIVLEPASGVFKEGKKTVIEYISVE